MAAAMRTLKRRRHFLAVHDHDTVWMRFVLRIGVLLQVRLDVIDAGNPDMRRHGLIVPLCEDGIIVDFAIEHVTEIHVRSIMTSRTHTVHRQAVIAWERAMWTERLSLLNHVLFFEFVRNNPHSHQDGNSFCQNTRPHSQPR